MLHISTKLILLVLCLLFTTTTHLKSQIMSTDLETFRDINKNLTNISGDLVDYLGDYVKNSNDSGSDYFFKMSLILTAINYVDEWKLHAYYTHNTIVFPISTTNDSNIANQLSKLTKDNIEGLTNKIDSDVSNINSVVAKIENQAMIIALNNAKAELRKLKDSFNALSLKLNYYIKQ